MTVEELREVERLEASAQHLRERGAIVILPDEDGDGPDWFYQALSDRLVRIGGRPKGDPQWEDRSYRMAYAAVVWRALRAAQPQEGANFSRGSGSSRAG